MYPDPKRVRDNRITLRLDDYEYALIEALANYQGDQPSTMVRELVLREAQQVLAGSASVETGAA
ncbi:hypothetical protein ACFJIX_18795 [Roseateles sp. UC29_93]|uniref:hypothetical protein n=1 Tax=Roseateles sp. UC29_93 TaxID=3350177 RepID=UPI00366A78FB